MSFYRFLVFLSIKNFVQVMGLLFGSAGAHIYSKSGQVASPPPLLDIIFFDGDRHMEALLGRPIISIASIYA